MVLDRLRRGLVDSFVGTDRRILALAIARMADSFGNSFLIVVLPLYVGIGPVQVPSLGGRLPILGITLGQTFLIGLLLSLFGFLNSFGQPFTGRLSDRMGRRRAFILFGLVLLGVANGAYAFVTDYRLLIVLRIVQGLGAAFTIPATIALVNELSPGEGRGGNFGVFNTFRLIGFGFGPVVAGAIVSAGPGRIATYSLFGRSISGFDAAFAIAAIGAFVSFVLITLFVSDPEDLEANATDDLSFRVFAPTSGQLLDPVFAVGLATLFMAISLGSFATLEGVVNQRLSQGGFLFSIEFAAGTLANVLFQTPIGRASDRLGRRPFLLAGFVCLVPSTFVQGFVTSPAPMVVARFVQGIGIALVFAPGLAFAGDLARKGESGTQLSVLTTAFGLGVAIGPLASGVLVGYGFVWPFVVGAALGVIGLVIVYTQIEETVKNPEAPAELVSQD